MKKKALAKAMCLGWILSGAALQSVAQDKITSTFNPENVILPSSQYTPGQPYQAKVWVCNTGQNYDSQYYNHVWATPDNDAEGRPWYAIDYEPTDGQYAWEDRTAPFSSDEYYKDQKSYQWVTAEIMGEMYMRRSFTINSPISKSVFLTTGHDDAPSEWYINGVKVYSADDGWNNDDYVLLTDEQKALIKTDGTENILAVHVHQNWGGAFADCGLYEADMAVDRNYLSTVAEGPWECLYYILNYNEDIAVAETAGWASNEEDEGDWISGVGPFSNDANMFLVTEWPSQVRPILIRRHFNLTATDIADMHDGELKLTCSYDENPKVYLNGTLIWSATGWNDNNYAEHTVTAEQKELLKEGDNVLAVSLTQGNGGGHIDYGLKLTKEYIPTAIAGTQTGITEAAGDNRVYNLNGQYIGTSAANMSKGIYIVNGKKYVKQ